MRKKFTKSVTGFCPIISDENTVDIEYSEIPILGSLKEQYKAVSIECSYFDQCTETYCPIMKTNPTVEI